MATEIVLERDYAGPIKVWHNDDLTYPSVSLGAGPFWACLQPFEARELAHALTEAADAATRKKTEGEAA